MLAKGPKRRTKDERSEVRAQHATCGPPPSEFLCAFYAFLGVSIHFYAFLCHFYAFLCAFYPCSMRSFAADLLKRMPLNGGIMRLRNSNPLKKLIWCAQGTPRSRWRFVLPFSNLSVPITTTWVIPGSVLLPSYTDPTRILPPSYSTSARTLLAEDRQNAAETAHSKMEKRFRGPRAGCAPSKHYNGATNKEIRRLTNKVHPIGRHAVINNSQRWWKCPTKCPVLSNREPPA
jgi:hypothetical protein